MIWLQNMTKEMAREYFKDFHMDPALYKDPSLLKPYVYSEKAADEAYERHIALGRQYLAIMLNERCIGEGILKKIDTEKKCCTLGISLQNDAVKNKGYGTKAEILLLEYAFENMLMETVYADALIKNRRSQHVLEKVGFSEISRDKDFVYYRCNRNSWQWPEMP